jgi:hypothetical protein
MTSKSWTASRIATLKKRAGTYTTRYVFSPMISIVSAVWLVLVICVVVLWCALDFIPKRRSKPLTSQAQFRRKLQIPLREGGDIFVLNPDGTKVALEPLEAKLQAEAWFQVVAGGFVFEKTRIKLDADG